MRSETQTPKKRSNNFNEDTWLQTDLTIIYLLTKYDDIGGRLLLFRWNGTVVDPGVLGGNVKERDGFGHQELVFSCFEPDRPLNATAVGLGILKNMTENVTYDILGQHF